MQLLNKISLLTNGTGLRLRDHEIPLLHKHPFPLLASLFNTPKASKAPTNLLNFLVFLTAGWRIFEAWQTPT